MKRLIVPELTRSIAERVDPHNIVCVHPRDLLIVVEKLNEIVELLNAKFPGEISHESLMAVLHGD